MPNSGATPRNAKNQASRQLNFLGTPIVEVHTSRSCTSSISSITASPSMNVVKLNKLVEDKSNACQDEDTEVTKILCRLKQVEEDCDRLLSEAQQHDRVRSLLTNNNILSQDYNSVNSSFGSEVASMKSTELSVSLTQGKRKRRKGAVQTIIDTSYGTKGGNERQAAVL